MFAICIYTGFRPSPSKVAALQKVAGVGTSNLTPLIARLNHQRGNLNKIRKMTVNTCHTPNTLLPSGCPSQCAYASYTTCLRFIQLRPDARYYAGYCFPPICPKVLLLPFKEYSISTF